MSRLVGQHLRRPRGDDRGLIEWGLLVTVTVLAIGFIIAGVVVANVARGSASVDITLEDQRAQAAVSDAVARLTDDQAVPSTRASATVACEPVSNRSACYGYWALPVPGNAADPLAYDLIVQTWMDKARTGTWPADMGTVRAQKLRLTAVTYQTGTGLDPTTADGRVQYVASPPGPLSAGLFGFRSVTIAGPDDAIGSFNSTTTGTATHTGNGTVASDGPVAYGSGVDVDRTVLYGSPDAQSDATTRCTGDPCAQGELAIRDEVYLPATDAAVAWMSHDLACTTTVDGDWVASANGGLVPAGTLCVRGSLLIDTPTRLSAAGTKIVVHGNVDIAAPLNAPSSTANPNSARLAVYSSGRSVALRADAYSAGPLVVAGIFYAPMAACSTDPASTAAEVGDPGSTTFYGALACDTVSIGGSFTQLQDDAALVQYTDPVPGAHKAWSVGAAELIDATSSDWDIPSGWDAGTCVMPGPTSAFAYWRLLEPSGRLAADSAGDDDLAWRASSSGRGTGLCGAAANLDDVGTPQVSGGTAIRSATDGVTLEWWGEGAVGTPVQAAGVTVTTTADHVSVTAGGATFKFPFTVQHPGSWHLYTLTVSNAGTAALYVDGLVKESGTVGTPSAGGATLIAEGSAGTLSDVVVYARVLSDTDVATRWATWNDNVVFSPTDPGTPFTAPGPVVDTGTTPALLKFSWTPASGTLPPDGSGTASYLIERSSTQTGTYESFGTVALDTTAYSQASPQAGSYWYRVCTVYNGDKKCGGSTNIVTVPQPTATTVTADNAHATTSTVGFSWPAQQYATSYEFEYRVNGGTWSAVNSTTATSWTAGPTAAGTEVDVQVRVVNPAGTSGWSNVAEGYLLPPAPTVSYSGVTNTSITFTWGTVTNAASYQAQHRGNGGAWHDDSLSGPAATSFTLTDVAQGTLVEEQVRAVNPAGYAGAWSAVKGTTLTVAQPAPNEWVVNEAYPQWQSYVMRSDGTSLCPSGTSAYSRARDGIAPNWNAWPSTWSDTNGSYRSSTKTSSTTSYSATVQIQFEIECVNESTGATSAVTTTSVMSKVHTLSAPSGLFISVPGNRTVSWGASCPTNSSPVYGVTISAATFTWQSGWGSTTSYSNQGVAWGKGTVSLGVYCTANGKNSGQSTQSASFG